MYLTVTNLGHFCSRWLDKDEDDGLIVREIKAGGSQMLDSECTMFSSVIMNFR